jgi:hypothetical protein
MSATNMSPNMGQVVGSMKPCQLCGGMRATSNVKFHRNIGMLLARQTRTIQADMCKTCMSKNYWDFMGKNLLLGPWGTISLIVTPIYLITNTYTYVAARHNLRGAIE